MTAPIVNNRPAFDQNGGLLFLTVAFPIHFWSIIAQLYQAQDVALWEIIGRAGYALLFALFESCLVFLVVWLVYRLVSRFSEPRLALALITWLYLALAAAAMLSQSFFMLDMSAGSFWFRLFTMVREYGRVVFPILLVVTAVGLLAPAIWLTRSPRVLDRFFQGLQRLSVLSLFYLVLDAAGLLVVVLRNITG